jgi:hypothetical protein
MIRYAPRTLSQAFAEQLETALATRKQKSSISNKRHKRTIDVAVMARNASHAGYTFFRSHVTNHILEHARKRKYSVEILGDPMEISASNNETTIEHLLNSKIVVCAQPDEWQDTTGILEAMASGALVLSDNILQAPTSPKRNSSGLIDGTNILFYKDLESLHQLVEYYLEHDEERLAIAKKGWEYSMGLQRSWQGMETILFGSSGTHARQPLRKAPSKRHD